MVSFEVLVSLFGKLSKVSELLPGYLSYHATGKMHSRTQPVLKTWLLIAHWSQQQGRVRTSKPKIILKHILFFLSFDILKRVLGKICCIFTISFHMTSHQTEVSEGLFRQQEAGILHRQTAGGVRGGKVSFLMSASLPEQFTFHSSHLWMYELTQH